MSIDIDWASLTTGAAGLELADTIRHFIHDKFQQIALPRFIRSVEVHSFAFGAHAPTITLKDVCDPLPDFYDDDDDDDDDGDGDESGDEEIAAARSITSSSPSSSLPAGASTTTTTTTTPAVAIAVAGAAPSSSLRTRRESQNRRVTTAAALFADGLSAPASHPQLPLLPPLAPPSLTPLSRGGSFVRAGTPGIPGGTSNLSYFHLPLGAGLGGPGAGTPLAAVSAAFAERRAGGEVAEMEAELSSRPSTARSGMSWGEQREGAATATMAAGTAAAAGAAESKRKKGDEEREARDEWKRSSRQQSSRAEPGPMDLQVVLRVEYAGDVRLALTTEILLDYPMPSFVGIPLTLSVTGARFDGVALLAYLRRRAHFCFLAPEDAEVLIGAEGGRDGEESDDGEGRRDRENQRGGHRGGPHGNDDATLGGLLREIRIESELGQKEGGKQVLKNVGKVEKFVLEQVRRIFEDEFVWPSYYTFLV